MTAPRTDAGRRDGKPQRSNASLGRRVRDASSPCARLAGHFARFARLARFALMLLGVAPAARAEHERAIRHVSLAALGGSTQPVGALADYQWDVRPHAAWGAQVLAGSGPYSAGVRFWQGGTTQGLGLAGVADPAVRTRSLELLVRTRVARWRKVELAALASGGRLAITWEPERLTVDAGGTPVTVTLSAVHEWVAGAGIALAVPFTGGWIWGIESERRLFALDTAHRNGSTVSLQRVTFGDWDARIALTHGWNW